MVAAFLIVCCQCAWSGYSLQDKMELPAEIVGVAQAAIHALSAEGRHQVRRVAKQEDAFAGKACCQDSMEGVDCSSGNIGRFVADSLLLSGSGLPYQSLNACCVKQLFFAFILEQHKLPPAALAGSGYRHRRASWIAEEDGGGERIVIINAIDHQPALRVINGSLLVVIGARPGK